MQRLISLFREPDELDPISHLSVPPVSTVGNPEPLYFLQILEFLRQRREALAELEQQEIGGPDSPAAN